MKKASEKEFRDVIISMCDSFASTQKNLKEKMEDAKTEEKKNKVFVQYERNIKDFVKALLDSYMLKG